jgi:hypothetical protein
MIPFEYVDDPVVQRNFEALSRRSIDTGGRSLGIRGGTNTVTFPGGSANTDPLTVSHGLERTPTSVQLTAIAATTPVDLFVVSGTEDADSFDVRGRMSDGSSPAAAATQNFYWLALG